MDLEDTILAVASPPGRSARGIIRISGPAAFDLLARTVDGFDPARPARGATPCRLRLEHRRSLPALLLLFPGPRSYTGDDAAELQVPGNPLLLERIVDHLIALAAAPRRARRAEPGEFTARAFLHGRLSLVQAEGVAAAIAARSDAQLRAARMMTDDWLGRFARALADDLAAVLALVEAGIDFTDQEDVVAIAPSDLHERLGDLAGRLEEQLAHAVGAEQLESIPWIVLTGPPNAGKSTLFNALLGHERAVISELAGTTRDVLAEPLHIRIEGDDAEVMLVDLAGLDDDQGVMNRRMQLAARTAIDRAELLIRCVPPGAPLPERSDPRDLVVRTKADTDAAVVEGRTLSVSAVSGAGLDALRRAVASRLAHRAVSLAADAIVLRPRHEAALRGARAHLDSAASLVDAAARTLDSPELVAQALRLALDEIAAVAGDVTPDDVLGRIFATFCVGK